MAPALVKHSAAKETNSGKKYLKLNCIPAIDIVCVDKLSKHSVFVKDMYKGNDNSENFTYLKSCSEAKSMLSDENLFPKLPTINLNNESLNNSFSDNKNSSPNQTKVVNMESSVDFKTLIFNKQREVVSKLFDVEKNMSLLNKRLRKFQFGAITSHVAKNSLKLVNENDLIDVVSTGKISNDAILSSRSKKVCKEKVKTNILCSAYDITKQTLQLETDDEDEYDHRTRLPNPRSKKKSDQ